jgi:glycogen debranching enzyme
MLDFAQVLGEPGADFDALAEQVVRSFGRFWYADGDYLYDLIDGSEGEDDSLRPNQLFAVSLHHSALTPQQAKAVVDVCTLDLLTPHGLRSLSQEHPQYRAHYGGDLRQRDGAYHQGTVWGWLIGPYASAHLRVYGDREAARGLLFPLMYQLGGHGLGSLSEIFDGDAPFTARGCIAQAWSVAEVLRIWYETR